MGPGGMREGPADPLEPLGLLLADLRTAPTGLSEREARRRLVVVGRNELERRAGPGLAREVATQLVHPLAILLWAAAALAFAGGTPALSVAIVAVILLNAAVAFVQERHAERAVEALRRYLPHHAAVLRDGRATAVEAALLVPGDVIVIRGGRPRLGRRPPDRGRARGRRVRAHGRIGSGRARRRGRTGATPC